MTFTEIFDSTLDLAFPKVPILASSTPVIHLKAIGEVVGHPNLWLKNDAEAGFLTGGSKVRALEYLIGRAISLSASTLRTFGDVESNFVLATAIYCVFYGIKPSVVLMKHWNEQVEDKANSLRNLSRLGASVRIVEPFRCILSSFASTYLLSRNRSGTFSVPIGGASPVGCIGYVAAARELGKQIEMGLLPPPSRIIFPVGSGGLFAGLLAGFSLLGDSLNLVGIRVAGHSNLSLIRLLAYRTRHLVLKGLRHASSTSKPISPKVDFHRYDPSVMDHSRYNKSKAIDLLKSTEGIQLDNKYAGPAMSAFLEIAVAASDKTSPLLFWNTYNGLSVEKAIDLVVQRNSPTL